jgi:hypothetical protein
MSDDSNKKWEHLVWGIGGLLLGNWLTRQQMDDSKKSRAERDDPQQSQELYEEMGDVLDDWEPTAGCKSEDDYPRDLAAYLESETDWGIELYKSTPEGKPDIIIGDLMVLEVKINPGRNEINRLIGQCAHYSRQWMTWMVVIGAGASTLGELERVLADKGLDHIEVWDF